MKRNDRGLFQPPDTRLLYSSIAELPRYKKRRDFLIKNHLLVVVPLFRHLRRKKKNIIYIAYNIEKYNINKNSEAEREIKAYIQKVLEIEILEGNI